MSKVDHENKVLAYAINKEGSFMNVLLQH